jgi:hypothetical protein
MSRPEYQTEPTWLAKDIWQRGHITPWELLRISAWKSAKALAPISLNSEDAIIERTTETLGHLAPLHGFDALGPDPDWDLWQDRVAWTIGDHSKRTGLLGLHGIGYPTATAVLCILNPSAFPVIDKWAVAAIYGPRERPQRHYRTEAYRRFAQALMARATDFPDVQNIHEIDQRLMNAAMPSVTTP